MVDQVQIQEFLKQASVPTDVRDFLSELVSGYLDTLSVCEKQAEDLEVKSAEIARLKAANEVVLQKVAAAPAFEKVAADIADELIDHQIIDPKSRDELIEAVVRSPEKVAHVIRNIFKAVVPLQEEGAGLDYPTKQAASTKNSVPSDDPFMKVIWQGA